MRVIRSISKGGFGVVDEVELPDGTRLARKTFAPASGASMTAEDLEKHRRRFLREVRVQAALSDDYTFPVTQSDLSGASPYFTMPLAEATYEEVLRADRASNRITREPLTDVLNALEAIHALGYVHRDLKPQNILKHAGAWKLADLGLILDPSSVTTQLTSTASAWGTRDYCSPEQVMGMHHVTAAADIYAFGCMLCDLVGVTPRVPFDQYTHAGQLGRIIATCTHKDPAQRYSSVAKLRDDLLTVLTEPSLSGSLPDLKHWVSALEDVVQWTPAQFAEFMRFLRSEHAWGSLDRMILRRALTSDVLTALQALDPSLWHVMAAEYCAWLEDGSFDFAYCDVLIGRLERIVALGDLGLQAKAALAAAKLAAGHNRWYVMRRVILLCGPALPEEAARRMALEIKIERRQSDFISCVTALGKDVSVYHPRIADAVLAPAE